MTTITAIETAIPCEIMTNLVLVRIHTDQGLVGCGDDGMAGLHCAVASANVVFQETVRAHIRTFYPRLIDRQPVIQRGKLMAPNDPGLGTSLLGELFQPGQNSFRRSQL